MPMFMSRRRSTRTAACWASVVRDDAGGVRASCTVGWPASGRSIGSGSRAPARTVPAWRGHLRGQGLVVIEVDRPNRQERRRNGKSDELDAIEAARAALSGRASGIAKSADGDVEAIRALLVVRRSGRNVRIKYLNQIRHLGFTAPDELRERLRDVHRDRLARTAAALRPTAGSDTVVYATKLAIATLGRRVLALEADAERLDHELETLVRRTAPSLLEVYGVGINTAAILLVAAGDNPHRLKSEAAFAHLCGVAPLLASSGKIDRHRLNPGGNRQANHALWRIVFTRMSSDERTRKYVARRRRRRQDHPRDHARLEALRRPRALPAPRARLNRSGVAGLAHECPDTNRLSFERTAGPPLQHVRHAWLHKSLPSPEWPITGLPAPPNNTLTTHRSFALA